ncbi:MAG: hypothetical protein LBR69_01985 [Endomicrobium sp.]|jgi:phosphoglycolate phosphatase-like HAD superfamily hydrolase|nr:hypothetical protein [Endomicrobium sp.]
MISSVIKLEKKSKIKNILFDLDGTLTDSAYDIVRAIAENGCRIASGTHIETGLPPDKMIRTVLYGYGGACEFENADKKCDDVIGIYTAISEITGTGLKG